jgi:hypothetical protein
MEKIMSHLQPSRQTVDSSASKILPPNSLRYELLDDIEAITDEEIDNYVCHLRQMGHEAFEMAA